MNFIKFVITSKASSGQSWSNRKNARQPMLVGAASAPLCIALRYRNRQRLISENFSRERAILLAPGWRSVSLKPWTRCHLLRPSLSILQTSAALPIPTFSCWACHSNYGFLIFARKSQRSQPTILMMWTHANTNYKPGRHAKNDGSEFIARTLTCNCDWNLFISGDFGIETPENSPCSIVAQ